MGYRQCDGGGASGLERRRYGIAAAGMESSARREVGEGNATIADAGDNHTSINERGRVNFEAAAGSSATYRSDSSDVLESNNSQVKKVPRKQLFGEDLRIESTVCSTRGKAGQNVHPNVSGILNSSTPRENVGNIDGMTGNSCSEQPLKSTGMSTPLASPRQQSDWVGKVTPPATVTEAEMGTPDAEWTYSHDDSIDPALVPKEGMVFKTGKEAYNFYSRYANIAGFGLNMGNKTKHSRWLRCAKEGKGEYYKKDPLQRKRNKTSMKTRCKARMKIKLTLGKNKEEQAAVIEQVYLDHNHVLTPGMETNLMTSHKAKDPVLLEYVDELQKCDVPAHSVKNIMREMHGGIENVGITDRDLENRRADNVKKDHSNDINKLLDFFNYCSAQNPHFRWFVKLDSEDKVHSLFWSYASMQGEYADFGDAMTFDTTHKTNIYGKPLAMFVGANNDLKNTLFGCALLGDETVETFKWVFKAFKKCMRKNRTWCLLTDQDQAMAAAIAEEFPGVIHRICRWHVVNKHSSSLKELYKVHKDGNLKERFTSVLNHPLTPCEFEAAWGELLDEFELHGDPTLESLYQQRHKFIPAYFKDDYCGRMTSTQRSESMNFAVKKAYFGKNTALHRFAKKTLDFMDDLRMKHCTETYHGSSKRVTSSQWPFEVQLSRVYTREVFKDFEKKMFQCTAYGIQRDQEGGEDDYLVKHTNSSSKITWGQHQFRVHADKCNEEYRCECREWEHTGLFCVHLMRAFIHVQVEKIPKEYILKRYSRWARRELDFDREDKLLGGKGFKIRSYRCKRLLLKFSQLVRLATRSSAACKRAEYVLDKLLEELEKIPADIECSNSKVNCSTSREDDSQDSGEEEENSEDEWEDAGQSMRDVIPCLDNEGREQGRVETQQESSDQGEINNTEETGGIKENEDNLRAPMNRDEAHVRTCVISLDPPACAKTKGRTIPRSEKNEVILGAKGEKKGTRRCSICEVYTTHNAATCPTKPENQARMEAMRNKKRGRPPGSKNRFKQKQDGACGGQEGCRKNTGPLEEAGDRRPMTRQMVTPHKIFDEVDYEEEESDESDTYGGSRDMDDGD